MEKFTPEKNSSERFINSSVSPNLEKVDVSIALKSLFSPFSLKEGDFSRKVAAWFKEKFSAKFASPFLSGREAEWAILKAIGVGQGDQVAVQAFTCVAVVDPIVWLNAKPIYVDVSEATFSMDIDDLKKKITKETKAIIIQHSFGLPANIEEIKKFAKERNVCLIEDCAHIIGGEIEGKKLGTWGDAAFFSFGRDKTVSSVYGGLVLTNDEKMGKGIDEIHQSSSYPSSFWITKQLLHPIFSYLVIKSFNKFPLLGKLLIFFLKKGGLISLPVTREEKNPLPTAYKASRYPNALAALCFSQLNRLDYFNQNRLELHQVYETELGELGKRLKFPKKKAYYLRIPVLTENREELTSFCRKFSVYLGDWYSKAVTPKDVDLEKIFYQIGSCPKAEKLAETVVNLPCYPGMNQTDAQRVVEVIKRYYEK